MKKICIFVTCLLYTITLYACEISATATPATQRIIGHIPTDHASFRNLTVLEAPQMVHVNQPFIVTVITYDSGSCTTVDGADVQIAGLVASITPYDRVPVGEVKCSADAAPHPRDVSLTFTTVGTATIRVLGQNYDGEQTVNEQSILVTQ